MSNPIYADFHVHTRLSPCGKREATAEAMIRRAQQKGLAAIGFADHYTPRPVPGCAFYARQRIRIVEDLRAEIARIEDVDGVDVLVGVEADYTLAGQDCVDAETLRQADHVICAASHFHLHTAPRPAKDTPRAKVELMLRMAKEALGMPGISVWAHPFDCSRMRPLVPILALAREDELAELIALANERGIAVEINGGPVRLEDYCQATAPFYALAHEMGTRFTITADAHHPDDFERLDLALAWARELGLRDEELLTCEDLIGLGRPTRSA
jgi:histidinol phosphatase-like PHP family hydrolase